MTYFKKLLLSAATLFVTAGAIKPAHAFFLSTLPKATNHARLQNPQPNNNLNPVAVSQAQIQDPFLPMKRILDRGNEEEIQKTRTQLIDFLIYFNANALDPNIPNVAQRQDELKTLREEILDLKEEVTLLRSLQFSQPSEDSTENLSQSTILTGFNTPRPSEEISPSPLLAGVMTARPTEDFDHDIFGIKPSTLEPMTQSEEELWKTFTMLTFPQDKDGNKDKPWSSWGGAYSTEELEEKFKDNLFMSAAFKEIAAFRLTSYDIQFFPEYIRYHTNQSPNWEMMAPQNKDLTKASYFRGLYRTLTGHNCSGRTKDFRAAEFKIDPTQGLSESRFTYGTNQIESSLYETSIYEAEEHFKNTPWHTLFINKVLQATLDSFPTLQTRIQKINDKYDAKIKTIADLIDVRESEENDYIQRLQPGPQERLEDLSTKDLKTELLTLTTKKQGKVEELKSQTARLLKATTLRDIDEVLGII